MGLFDTIRRAVGGGDDGSADEQDGADEPALIDSTTFDPDDFREYAEHVVAEAGPLTFDADALSTLDTAIAERYDGVPAAGEGSDGRYTEQTIRFGSYLGEILVREYGGQWVRGDQWGVTVAGSDDEVTVAVFEVAARSFADQPVFGAVAERLEAKLALDSGADDDAEAVASSETDDATATTEQTEGDATTDETAVPDDAEDGATDTEATETAPPTDPDTDAPAPAEPDADAVATASDADAEQSPEPDGDTDDAASQPETIADLAAQQQRETGEDADAVDSVSEGEASDAESDTPSTDPDRGAADPGTADAADDGSHADETDDDTDAVTPDDETPDEETDDDERDDTEPTSVVRRLPEDERPSSDPDSPPSPTDAPDRPEVASGPEDAETGPDEADEPDSTTPESIVSAVDSEPASDEEQASSDEPVSADDPVSDDEPATESARDTDPEQPDRRDPSHPAPTRNTGIETEGDTPAERDGHDSEPTAEPEPADDPDPEPDADSKSEPADDPGSETAADSEPDADSDPATDSGPGDGSPERDREPGPDPEPAAEPGTSPDAPRAPDTEPADEPNSDPTPADAELDTDAGQADAEEADEQPSDGPASPSNERPSPSEVLDSGDDADEPDDDRSSLFSTDETASPDHSRPTADEVADAPTHDTDSVDETDSADAPAPAASDASPASDPTVGDGLRATYAEHAVDFAEFWEEYDLDFTPSSLARLDEMTDAQWADDRFDDATFGQDAAFDDQVFTSVGTELGSYFGEVLVRHLDGEWTDETDHEAAVVVDGRDGPLAVPVFQIATMALRKTPAFAHSYDALLADLGRDGPRAGSE